MKHFPPTELALNAQHQVYHLGLSRDQVAQTVILVGDQDRVSLISNFFDAIEHKSQHREFVCHTGTYKGKLSIVWGDTYLQVTGVNGTGSGNVLGLTDMSGTASAAPAGICDTFDAKGSIAGGGSSLNVTFDSSAKGCAEDESAPTTIKITGTATITGGTGKYVGATGVLKVTGTFSVKGGSKEDAAFTMDVSGNIKTK